MKPTYEELELALDEMRKELNELYKYCAIIEDVLCAQSNRRLQ